LLLLLLLLVLLLLLLLFLFSHDGFEQSPLQISSLAPSPSPTLLVEHLFNTDENDDDDGMTNCRLNEKNFTAAGDCCS
jgi:hypothetical protein